LAVVGLFGFVSITSDRLSPFCLRGSAGTEFLNGLKTKTVDCRRQLNTDHGAATEN
jgi:hypothetical protein